MIDLHLHTKYSDGAYTVRELINILNQNNIKYASITDHNSIGGIQEFIDNDYQSLFNGIMIPGVEIQTLVGKYLIDVLVYNYNIEEYQNFINETNKNFWTFHKNAYQELLKVADSLGLKYTEPERELENGYYANLKFQDAIQAHLDYNKRIIDEKIITDIRTFYLGEFQNPNSIFFIDNKRAFPKLEDTIGASHECGGIVSLAHIDEYKAIKDKSEFLEYLIKHYNIDAIECVHPSINKRHEKKYMDYTKEHGLLVSAGSDFHGPHLEYRKKINTQATLEDTTILKRILK